MSRKKRSRDSNFEFQIEELENLVNQTKTILKRIKAKKLDDFMFENRDFDD